MNRHSCPNCGTPSISVRQKLGLGPLKKIRCTSCGAFITVPWLQSLLVMGVGSFAPVLGFLALTVAPQPLGLVAAVVSFVLGFALGTGLFLWLYNRLVPLVVKRA